MGLLDYKTKMFKTDNHTFGDLILCANYDRFFNSSTSDTERHYGQYRPSTVPVVCKVNEQDQLENDEASSANHSNIHPT